MVNFCRKVTIEFCSFSTGDIMPAPPELKATLNLPQYRFPHEGKSAPK